jgi:hypothetical protein
MAYSAGSDIDPLHRMYLTEAVDAYEALGSAEPAKPRANRVAPQTAHDAATYLQDSHREVARRVYDCIVHEINVRGGVGLTSDEVERRLRMPHQTVSARINQLRDANILRDSTIKRRTGACHDGREAIVWCPTQIAWDAEPRLRRF